jgi:hypothetical protein
MKRFVTLITLVLLPFTVGAGFDEYPVITIEQMLASQAGSMAFMKKPKDRRFDGVTASKSRVTCSGDIRHIPVEKKKYLDEYFASRKQPEFAALFEDEVLCREGKREYWLPIQKPVLEYFRNEVKPGSVVDLYLVLAVSYIASSGELVHVMGIGEFQVPNVSK